MLYREIIAVCSQINTKHINTMCGQNVELLNVKLVVHIVTNEHYCVKEPKCELNFVIVSSVSHCITHPMSLCLTASQKLQSRRYTPVERAIIATAVALTAGK